MKYYSCSCTGGMAPLANRPYPIKPSRFSLQKFAHSYHVNGVAMGLTVGGDGVLECCKSAMASTCRMARSCHRALTIVGSTRRHWHGKGQK